LLAPFVVLGVAASTLSVLVLMLMLVAWGWPGILPFWGIVAVFAWWFGRARPLDLGQNGPDPYITYAQLYRIPIPSHPAWWKDVIAEFRSLGTRQRRLTLTACAACSFLFLCLVAAVSHGHGEVAPNIAGSTLLFIVPLSLIAFGVRDSRKLRRTEFEQATLGAMRVDAGTRASELRSALSAARHEIEDLQKAHTVDPKALAAVKSSIGAAQAQEPSVGEVFDLLKRQERSAKTWGFGYAVGGVVASGMFGAILTKWLS
jgi:hypothetical protein